MALKWVKALKRINRIAEDNSRETYYPGDWFQANNQEIRKRLAMGEVAIYAASGEDHIYLETSCGVVASRSELSLAALGNPANGLGWALNTGLISSFLYTLYWRGGNIRPELLPASFELLKTWEMAVPLGSFDTLADGIGTDEDRALTLKTVGDLRIPVYDTLQMYVKTCPATQQLFAAWKAEKAKLPAGDERLAFIRALYLNPLMILALPPSWITGISRD